MSPALHAPPACAPQATPDAPTGRSLPPGQRGRFDVDLVLRHSGRHRIGLRFERAGTCGAPVVFVAGGISAGRHVIANRAAATPGWWQAQAAPGSVLDPASVELLAFDWIGADGALDAVIDPADQADAIAALLDHLGIGRLHAFVGASYGAMVGLQFAARHAGRVGQVVAISGTHRAHPYSSALRALQRRAVVLGSLQCDALDGLALARQLAMLTYRTPEEFAERFGPAVVTDGIVRVPAEDYLDHCAQAYVRATPPLAFLRLSESIDLQHVDPWRIDVPVTLVAVEEDRLVPLTDVYALAQTLRGETRLRILRSRYGHDAFLKAPEAIASVLSEALDAAVPA